MKRLKSAGFLLILLLGVLFFLLPGFAYANFAVDSVTEVGPVENPSRPGLFRDGGAGGQVGAKYLWTFGDTLFNPASVDGTNGRSNSAGISELSNFLSVAEPLDANNAPYQFIELSAADKAYNDSHTPDDRYAIWPTAVVAKDSSSAFVYYVRLKVDPGWLNYTYLSTGVAEVAEGQTVATKITDSLFTAPHAFDSAGFGYGGYVYLYGCQTPLNAQCKVARAPVAEGSNLASFEYWDGSSWNADINSATLATPGSTIGFGVGWNDYLNKFVMVTAPPFSRDIELRYADAPQGPWSDPQKIFTAPDTSKDIRAVYVHPELSLENGRVMRLSYYSPSADDDWSKDRKVMIEVAFTAIPGADTGAGGSSSGGEPGVGSFVPDESGKSATIGVPRTGAGGAVYVIILLVTLSGLMAVWQELNHCKSKKRRTK